MSTYLLVLLGGLVGFVLGEWWGEATGGSSKSNKGDDDK